MSKQCEKRHSQVSIDLITRDINNEGDNEIGCEAYMEKEMDENVEKTELKEGLMSQDGYLNYGEEDQMTIKGYRENRTFLMLSWLVTVLTCGILQLVFFWKPSLKLKFIFKHSSLEHADVVYLKDQYGNMFVERVEVFQKLARGLEAVEVKEEGDSNESAPLVQLFGEVLNATKYFENKKRKYIWNKHTAHFHKLSGLEAGTRCNDLHEMGGLSVSDQSQLQSLFGVNLIDVPLTPYWKLLLTEALDPLYIFQLFSVILWFCDNYIYFASIILIISIIILAQSVYEIRANQKLLKKKIHPCKQVLVLRRSAIKSEEMSCQCLVPGDLLEIPKRGCVMQCDAVLISGDCIVNESMLTGESVPVTKTPLPPLTTPFDLSQHSRHTLFSGTEVIQTRYYDEYKVYAVVLRTGFSTTKGDLVRSIMFPKPMDLRFSRDVSHFILFLFLIASVGMVYTFVIMVRRGDEIWHMIVRALDLVTIVIPPTLPAALTTCVRLAEGRLKRKKIYCLSLRSLNMCGMVNVFCFDKTGTLTEEGLDFKCLLPTFNSPPANTSAFKDEVKEVAMEMVETDHVMVAMASCHSITIVDGCLMGDPLDMKMFEASNWHFEKETQYDDIVPTIIKPPSGSPSAQSMIQVGVVRVFPFSSQLQRMSVITKRLDVDNRYDCYVKGSPEMIVSFCKKNTVPSDFHEVLTSYAQLGYRVIALAYKPCKKTFLKIQQLRRDTVEKDLSLLGLLVFENRLKPQSTPVIKLLSDANIRTLMVTGDNIQTALSVARKCGMVQRNQHAILVSIKHPPKPPPHQPCHASNEEGRVVDGHEDIEFTLCEDAKKEADVSGGGDDRTYIMEGKTWAVVRKHHPELLKKLTREGTVFARFLPEQKQQLIEVLQEDGKYVGMCGDGANDCGALKTAHTGISLSEAEASVASPFTSNEPNITCVIKVIREGRAALVSSSGNFRFLAGYSLTQFISICLLYWVGASFTDFIFLYIDLVLIFSLSYTFNRTGAYKHLSPTPPPITLLSFSSVLSILLQLILNSSFQVFVWTLTTQQPWFVPFVDNPSDKYQCHEVTNVFLLSSFQYVILAVVFSKGPPYRKSIFTNGWFMVSIVLGTLSCAYFTLYPASWIVSLMELSPSPSMEFRGLILVLAIFNLILNFFVECIVIEKLLALRGNRVCRAKKSLWSMMRRRRGVKMGDGASVGDVSSRVRFIQPSLQPATFSNISQFSSTTTTTRAIDVDNLPLIDDPLNIQSHEECQLLPLKIITNNFSQSNFQNEQDYLKLSTTNHLPKILESSSSNIDTVKVDIDKAFIGNISVD